MVKFGKTLAMAYAFLLRIYHAYSRTHIKYINTYMGNQQQLII